MQGLMPGEGLSPYLFSLYINDFENELIIGFIIIYNTFHWYVVVFVWFFVGGLFYVRL